MSDEGTYQIGDLPEGLEQEYIDDLVLSLKWWQEEIAFNLHLRDTFRDEPEIVWRANEFIKEAGCQLQWFKKLITRAMK